MKSKIQLLLDPDARAPFAFQSFNREMGQLLGNGIWSGNRYEAQQHSDESICWLKAREGAQEILHCGVIHASLEISSTWGNPQFLVAEMTGVKAVNELTHGSLGLVSCGSESDDFFPTAPSQNQEIND